MDKMAGGWMLLHAQTSRIAFKLQEEFGNEMFTASKSLQVVRDQESFHSINRAHFSLVLSKIMFSTFFGFIYLEI